MFMQSSLVTEMPPRITQLELVAAAQSDAPLAERPVGRLRSALTDYQISAPGELQFRGVPESALHD